MLVRPSFWSTLFACACCWAWRVPWQPVMIDIPIMGPPLWEECMIYPIHYNVKYCTEGMCLWAPFAVILKYIVSKILEISIPPLILWDDAFRLRYFHQNNGQYYRILQIRPVLEGVMEDLWWMIDRNWYCKLLLIEDSEWRAPLTIYQRLLFMNEINGVVGL